MDKFFGGRIEVHIETGTVVVLKVRDEGRAEGSLILLAFFRKQISQAKPTLPAPAGPITRHPNLLMMFVAQWQTERVFE